MAKRTKPGNRLKNGRRRGNPRIAEAGKATRFQPGNNANPSGRPPDVFSQIMRKMMPMPCPLDKNGRTWAEAVVLAAFKKAVRGDIRAAAEIFDRTEGKPRQSVDLAAVGAFANVQVPTSLEEADRRLEEIWMELKERVERRKAQALTVGATGP